MTVFLFIPILCFLRLLNVLTVNFFWQSHQIIPSILVFGYELIEFHDQKLILVHWKILQAIEYWIL